MGYCAHICEGGYDMDSGNISMDKTPWSQKDSLPKASPLAFIICMVLSSVCGALIPTSDLILMFLWIMLGASFLAVNITLNRTLLAFISLPISYAAGWILSDSPAFAALALLYAIPAIVISACLLSGTSCSGTVAALTATQSAMTLGVYALALHLSYGSVEKGLTEVYSLMHKYTSSMLEYAETIAKESGLDGIFSSSMADELLRSVIAVLPGALIFITIISSAITVKLTWKYFKILKCQKAFRSDGWHITVSSAACYLYLISYFGSVLFNLFVESEIPRYTCANLSTILMPAMFLCGVRSLKHRLSKTSTTAKTVAIIVCVVSAIAMPSLLSVILLIITFSGALSVIKSNRKIKTDSEN